MYEIDRRQEVTAPLEEVFAFFERPDNLAKITPADMGFVILTPPPLVTRNGAVLDYVLRILGWEVHWRTMITSYDPPSSFVDEQLAGPYLFWHHAHVFERTPHGTAIIDRIRYVMPFGPLGTVAQVLFVKRRLEYIFKFRAAQIAQLFGVPSEPNKG